MTEQPSGGLSPDQRAALADAESGLKLIRRAERWAGMNAWTLAIFAGITLLFGRGNLFSMVLGGALGGLAWNEFQGLAALRRLDPAGARRLGWNQLAILAVVAVYCGVQFWRARYGTPDAALAELEELAGFEPGWISELTAALYAAVTVAVGGIQALMARFHFRREPMLAAWRQETPAWVREVLEVTSGDSRYSGRSSSRTSTD